MAEIAAEIMVWEGYEVTGPFDQKIEVFAVDDPGSDRWKTTRPRTGNERM